MKVRFAGLGCCVNAILSLALLPRCLRYCVTRGRRVGHLFTEIKHVTTGWFDI